MTDEFRLFGPPGTGKTTQLAKWITDAAEKYGSDAILVASFTRSAATELVQRNLPIEPSHVGTLHALCYRTLGSPTIAETKTDEFNDSQSHYRLSGGSRDLDEPDQGSSIGDDALLNAMNVQRAVMRHMDDWPREVAAFGVVWNRWKAATGYIDFTDMIELALYEGEGVPFRCTIGFFDEVQDFTPLELALVRWWSTQMDYVVLAGDDDQCLYSFKGASPDTFLNPPTDDSHKFILSQSYRVPGAVHRLSQEWISKVREREPKDYQPRQSEGEVERRNELTYRFSAPQIARELAQRGDVMAIASCSYQIAPVVKALREQGIPFHNPYRRRRGDWNPLHGGGRGVGTAQRITSLLAPRWTYSDLARWMPLVRKRGVVRTGRWDAIIEQQSSDLEVSEAMLGQVFEDGVIDAARNSPLTWLRDHALASKARAVEFPLLVAERSGVEALTARPRIVVGTIHSVKGGEAETVYLFPDLSPQGAAQHQLGDDSVRRMMYVGMTRARQTLVLCGQSAPEAVTL